MPIAINPIGNTLPDTRPLRALDQDNSLGTPRVGPGRDFAANAADRLQERLELVREQNAQRAELRQTLAEERRAQLREELAEEARVTAEEVQNSLQDRLRQQQVERVLDARRTEQTGTDLADETQSDSLAVQESRVEASQLTFGPQSTVTTRTAIEAISLYQETSGLSA